MQHTSNNDFYFSTRPQLLLWGFLTIPSLLTSADLYSILVCTMNTVIVSKQKSINQHA